jgi:drug/metabolite transporter (DMT)-like permease
MDSDQKNFQLGLIFISTAVVFWGLLPVALKLTGLFVDAITLTWIRFLFALIFSFIVQFSLGRLNEFKQLNPLDWGKLIAAGLFLIVNYVTFVWCLDYLEPGAAQLNFQTAPFYLALGGLVFLKEKITLIQGLLFAMLAIGLLMFFHPALSASSANERIVWGILLVQLSSFCWCIYALLQKGLHSKLSPANSLLFIFGLGVLVMFPQSEVNAMSRFDEEQWLVVLFCSLNTIIAYGCFAQSMKYWPTVQVSAMIALTPVASFSTTILCVSLGWWPEIISHTPLDLISLGGIVIVILSAASVQLFSRGKKQPQVLIVKK